MQVFLLGPMCTRILIFKIFISCSFLLPDVKEKILNLRKKLERKHEIMLENKVGEIKLFPV